MAVFTFLIISLIKYLNVGLCLLILKKLHYTTCHYFLYSNGESDRYISSKMFISSSSNHCWEWQILLTASIWWSEQVTRGFCSISSVAARLTNL